MAPAACISKFVLDAITIVFILVRVWINRTHGQKRLLASDYLALTHIPLVVGITVASTIVSVDNGYSEEEFEKEAMIANTMVTVLMWVLKAAFVALYYKIFSAVGRRLRIALHVLTGYVAASFVAAVLGQLLSCHPLSDIWKDPSSPDWCLWGNSPAYLTYYICTLTSDVGIAIYPAFLLLTMRQRRRVKIAIVFAIAVGCISIVGATLRFAILWPPTTQQQIRFGVDASKPINDAMLYTAIEIFGAAVANCLPAFRVLLRPSNPPDEQG